MPPINPTHLPAYKDILPMPASLPRAIRLFALLSALGTLSACGPGGGGAGPSSVSEAQISAVRFGKAGSLARTMIALVPEPRAGQIKFGTVGMSRSQVLVMSRSRGISEPTARRRLITACLKSARGARVTGAQRQDSRGELGLFIDCAK